MTSEKMAQQIKELRRVRGLTQQQVADQIGCSLMAVNRLENGSRRMTMKWAQEFARVLQVPVGTLIDSANYDLHITPEWIKTEIARNGIEKRAISDAAGMTPSQFSKMLNGTRRLRVEEAKAINEFLISAVAKKKIIPNNTAQTEKTVPHYTLERANGELGSFVKKISGRVSFPIEEADLAVTMRGVSMSPKYEVGDVLFLSRAEPRVGQYGLFEFGDGSVSIKRFESVGEKGYILSSLNDGQQQEFTEEQIIESYTIIGCSSV